MNRIPPEELKSGFETRVIPYLRRIRNPEPPKVGERPWFVCGWSTRCGEDSSG